MKTSVTHSVSKFARSLWPEGITFLHQGTCSSFVLGKSFETFVVAKLVELTKHVDDLTKEVRLLRNANGTFDDHQEQLDLPLRALVDFRHMEATIQEDEATKTPW